MTRRIYFLFIVFGLLVSHHTYASDTTDTALQAAIEEMRICDISKGGTSDLPKNDTFFDSSNEYKIAYYKCAVKHLNSVIGIKEMEVRTAKAKWQPVNCNSTCCTAESYNDYKTQHKLLQQKIDVFNRTSCYDANHSLEKQFSLPIRIDCMNDFDADADNCMMQSWCWRVRAKYAEYQKYYYTCQKQIYEARSGNLEHQLYGAQTAIRVNVSNVLDSTKKYLSSEVLVNYDYDKQLKMLRDDCASDGQLLLYFHPQFSDTEYLTAYYTCVKNSMDRRKATPESMLNNIPSDFDCSGYTETDNYAEDLTNMDNAVLDIENGYRTVYTDDVTRLESPYLQCPNFGGWEEVIRQVSGYNEISSKQQCELVNKYFQYMRLYYKCDIEVYVFRKQHAEYQLEILNSNTGTKQKSIQLSPAIEAPQMPNYPKNNTLFIDGNILIPILSNRTGIKNLNQFVLQVMATDKTLADRSQVNMQMLAQGCLNYGLGLDVCRDVIITYVNAHNSKVGK